MSSSPRSRAAQIPQTRRCWSPLAGSMKADLTKDPLGSDKDGKPVYLRDIWPSNRDIHDEIKRSLTPEMFKSRYANVFEGPIEWRKVKVTTGLTYKWQPGSTYV